jgi:hypothetical protein
MKSNKVTDKTIKCIGLKFQLTESEWQYKHRRLSKMARLIYKIFTYMAYFKNHDT